MFDGILNNYFQSCDGYTVPTHSTPSTYIYYLDLYIIISVTTCHYPETQIIIYLNMKTRAQDKRYFMKILKWIFFTNIKDLVTTVAGCTVPFKSNHWTEIIAPLKSQQQSLSPTTSFLSRRLSGSVVLSLEMVVKVYTYKILLSLFIRLRRCNNWMLRHGLCHDSK